MNHPLRDYTRQLFTNAIGAGASARNAEIGILNWSVKNARSISQEASWDNPLFRNIYRQKVAHLAAELKRAPMVEVRIGIEGSHVKVDLGVLPQLVHRLRRKDLDVKKLATYPAEILWLDGPHARAIFKHKEKENKIEQAKANEDGYEGMFKCRKCGSKKTRYYQMQTRSADEPMTTYVTCTACGLKWKC
jgi:hypothetical protein